MKKLETAADKEKRQRKVKLFMGIFLAAVMVFSTLGYALVFGGSTGGHAGQQIVPEPVQNQAGPTFNGQYWVYDFGGQQFAFTHTADSVSEVPVETNLTIQDYVGTNMYVVSDNQAVLQEIGQNVGRFASRYQQACLGECEENLPEKDCSDFLVIYEESEDNEVYQEGKCVFIEGNLTAVDAYLYSITGIR